MLLSVQQCRRRDLKGKLAWTGSFWTGSFESLLPVGTKTSSAAQMSSKKSNIVEISSQLVQILNPEHVEMPDNAFDTHSFQ